MKAMQIAGIVLIAAGVIGLVYGGFSYTSATHEADIGPIEISVTEKETVTLPLWVGVGTIAFGGALLLFGAKKA